MSTSTQAIARFLLICVAFVVVLSLQWSEPLLPIANAQDDGTDPDDPTATYFIRNPNFEDGTLTPWTKQPANGNGTVEIESCCANALPLSGGHDAALYPQTGDVRLQQAVLVAPNTNYYLSAWVSTRRTDAQIIWWNNGNNQNQMGSSWILGNNPIAIEGEISIGIHVVVITDQHITLVYSVPDNSGSTPNIDDVKLTDHANNAYKILGATSLARIEGLQIGSITFEGPKPGITRLDLFVQSKVGQLMVNVAQADIPNTPPGLIEGMQNLIPREDYLEQEKYRVSFNGFSPQTGDLVGLQKNVKGMTKEEVLSSNATRVASTPGSSEPPTAFPQHNVTSKLSEGKPLVGGATIRIENQSTKQAQYLYIVFLTDGNVKAQWLE